MSEDFLSVDEWLGASDEAPQVFESNVWKSKDGKPGKIQYRRALVDDKASARKYSKIGDDFDNTAYGLKLVQMCVLKPKVSDMDINKMRQKDGKEFERLLSAIIGEADANPQ